MNLSRRQKLALMFLAAYPWAEHDWTSIGAVLVMHGETTVNGRVTASGLVRKGLAAVNGCLYRIAYYRQSVRNVNTALDPAFNMEEQMALTEEADEAEVEEVEV